MENSGIRKAGLNDITEILSTYSALHEHERQYGVNTNWSAGVYPVPELPLKKIESGAMYVLDNGAICASMAIDSACSPEYEKIDWRYQAPPEKILTIHVLVVDPRKFGSGYGKRMISFAKNFGLKNGFQSIRIDTWIHNEPAKSLYVKNGFEIAGYGPISLYGLHQDEVYLECKLVKANDNTRQWQDLPQ